MFDFLSDFAKAWGDRIRSPILGSIFLAFIILNWKAVYFLIFADKPVYAKFLFFDANTNFHSTTWIPVLSGLAISLLSPWLKFVGSYFAKVPLEKLSNLERDSAVAKEIYNLNKTAEFEEASGRLQAAIEENKIAEAERTQKIDDLGSDELKEEIKDVRNSNKPVVSKARISLEKLSKLEIEIVKFLGINADDKWEQSIFWKSLKQKSDDSTGIIANYSDGRLKVDVDAGLDNLRSQGIVTHYDTNTNPRMTITGVRLTSFGFKVLDENVKPALEKPLLPEDR